MSKERDPGWSKAVQLVHGRCGWIVGTAEPASVVQSGTGATQHAQVSSVRITPNPVTISGTELLECRRCNRPVAVSDGRDRAAALLSEALVWSNRGLETREDGRRVGSLRVSLGE